MTSIAERDELTLEGVRAPVPVPSWLAPEMAGLLSAGALRRWGVKVPDGAMRPLVTELQAWLNNVSQGSMVNPEYAAFLELVRRGQGWRDEPRDEGEGIRDEAARHPDDAALCVCGMHVVGAGS